jgi:SAM-dependent methyltransferase
MAKEHGKKRKRRTATGSDKWELYELSVQEPEADCAVVEQFWQEIRGRRARHIREDFCGTAVNSIEWVRRDSRNTAVGVDISPDVLALARTRIGKRLTPDARKRITLVESDVIHAKTKPVDAILATNFSFFIFKTRRKMKRYFKACRDALVEDGLLILDAYGGSDSFLEMREPRDVEDFVYVWDQAHYNPVNGDAINHIHFKFKDGTKMERAFTYEWRLWTLPELTEILYEAGFENVTCYWEGTDAETEEGNGEFSPTRTGEACPGWVAYLVAER